MRFQALYLLPTIVIAVLSTTPDPRDRIIPASCPDFGGLSDWPNCPSPSSSNPSLAAISFENDCCYMNVMQICTCKAVDDWCRFHFSNCCGPVGLCAEQCVCVPEELKCQFGDEREVCDGPYAGEKGGIPFFAAFRIPDCPVCEGN